jgi:beta-glucanase (GH16 family)
MKRFYKFSFAFLTVATDFTVCQAQICAGSKVILLDRELNDGETWQLEFEDNFNGNTLDLSKWKLSESSQGSFDGTGAYNTLDNIEVSPENFYGANSFASGVCKIIIKEERVTHPAVSWDPNSPEVTYNYTSSNMVSKQEFGWGKYEIRCKLPKGKGFFPAFWMYGEQYGSGNEIDVFEFMNEKNVFGKYDENLLCRINQMHYHIWDKTFSQQGIDRNCGSSSGAGPETDYSLDYHIFAVIWDRWAISWFVDGKLLKSAGQWYDLNGRMITPENIKPAQTVLRNDWYPKGTVSIIVNLAVQHGINEPDNKTPFPSSLDIDYIRYYKRY